MTQIASRTPEGESNWCPVCQARVCIEPSRPAGDAPCPNCGVLLWFLPTSAGVSLYETEAVATLRDRINAMICADLGVNPQAVANPSSFIEDIGNDSLDVAELLMELEVELDITIPEDTTMTIRTACDLMDTLLRNRR